MQASAVNPAGGLAQTIADPGLACAAAGILREPLALHFLVVGVGAPQLGGVPHASSKLDFDIAEREGHAGVDPVEVAVGLAQMGLLRVEHASRDQLDPAQAAFAGATGVLGEVSMAFQGIEQRLTDLAAEAAAPTHGDLHLVVQRHAHWPAPLLIRCLGRAVGFDADAPPRHAQRGEQLHAAIVEGRRPADVEHLAVQLTEFLLQQLTRQPTTAPAVALRRTSDQLG